MASLWLAQSFFAFMTQSGAYVMQKKNATSNDIIVSLVVTVTWLLPTGNCWLGLGSNSAVVKYQWIWYDTLLHSLRVLRRSSGNGVSGHT